LSTFIIVEIILCNYVKEDFDDTKGVIRIRK